MRNNILKDHIGYWVNRLRQCVHYEFEAHLNQYGISVAAWCILVSIYDGSAQTIKELSEYIEVDKASVSRVVARLTSMGYLTHGLGKDRRTGLILLTKEGASLVPNLIKVADEYEKKYFGSLSLNEVRTVQKVIYTALYHTTSIDLERLLNNDFYKEIIMQKIQDILTKAKEEKTPYPITFEALKAAGVNFYVTHFIEEYKASYYGTFGTFIEESPTGYSPYNLASIFSEPLGKKAIMDHIKIPTTYLQCLQDLAAAGISHYRVDMDKRTVTYFNSDETKFFIENVPEI